MPPLQQLAGHRGRPCPRRGHPPRPACEGTCLDEGVGGREAFLICPRRSQLLQAELMHAARHVCHAGLAPCSAGWSTHTCVEWFMTDCGCSVHQNSSWAQCLDGAIE